MPDASGQSAGLSVAISIPQSAGATTIIQLSDVTAWGIDLEASIRKRMGRTNTLYPQLRTTSTSGGFEVKGISNHAKPPIPTAFAGLAATLTITASATAAETKSVDFPVKIISFKFGRKELNNNQWPITATFEIVGAPTWSAGWGTLLDPSAPSKTNEEQWAGSFKVFDPDSINTYVQRTIDWWAAVTNSDAAEQTYVTTTISTTTPFTTPHNAKLFSRQFLRDALDGGTIVEVWKLATAAEDAINSATTISTDPNALESYETNAAFNTTAAGTISGLVVVSNTTKEYNDSMVLNVTRRGPRSTIENITFPGTVVTDDLSTIAIRSGKTEAAVTSSSTPSNPTPPAGLKLRERYHHQLTDAGKHEHHFIMGLTTIQEDAENEGSTLSVDAAGIGTFEYHRRIVATASTADPDSGTVTSGLSLHSTATKEINDNAFARDFHYRQLTSAEEIEHRGRTSSGGTNGVTAPPTTIDTINTTISTVTGADTTESLVQAAIVTAQALTTRPFKRISVTKVNKLRAATRIETPCDDFAVWMGQPSVSQERRAVDATGSNVSVQMGVALTSGKSRLYLGHFVHNVVRYPVVLRRWRRTANPESLLYPALIGCKNSGTGSGAVPGSVTLSGGAVTAVGTGTAGSGYSTDDVFTTIIGNGSGAIVKANTSTTSGVTSYTVVNGGAGYTGSATAYVTGGAVFMGITSACWVYRGGTIRYNLREQGGARWVCYDYLYEVVGINNGSGALIDGNIFNGLIPMDTWVDSTGALPTIPSTQTASSVRSGYVSSTLPASIGWGVAFSGQ